MFTEQKITHVYYTMSNHRIADDVDPNTNQPRYSESEESLKRSEPLAEIMPLKFAELCAEQSAKIVFQSDPEIISETEWDHYLNVMPPTDFAYQERFGTRYCIFKLGERSFAQYTQWFIKVSHPIEGITYYKMNGSTHLSHNNILGRLIRFLKYGSTKQNAFAANIICVKAPNKFPMHYSTDYECNSVFISGACCILAEPLENRKYFDHS